MGANTSVVKKNFSWRNTNEIQWLVKKSEWKNTVIWKAKVERPWIPTRAKTQDTRASPNSLGTHLVRKWRDIEHLRALSQGMKAGAMDGLTYWCLFYIFNHHWFGVLCVKTIIRPNLSLVRADLRISFLGGLGINPKRYPISASISQFQIQSIT